MGSAFSARVSHHNNNKDGEYDCGSQSSSKPGLADIPESCISSLLMNFDPTDICKLAQVNRAFHRASSADFLWESKLPEGYKSLLNHVLGSLVDKCSGQMCLFMSAKSLKITGIDDRRYWNYIPTEESRFNYIAYLQQMWWVEILGELEFEFPRGTYSLCFRLQLGKPIKRLGRRVRNIDQVHGWGIKPVRFQLSTSDGQHSLSECYLNGPGEWAYYHFGDFVVDSSDGPTKIKFSLAQIDCTHTKGGLCIDCAFICPITGLSVALNGIPVLNGTNFKNWKERIMIVLGCLDLDHALRLDHPAALTYGSSNVDRIAYEK
ncbi:F-box protein PP2-A13-like [Senna tora]|uniref:F-box protein PP2-A13-like n=1 Tax=Senna tora TaxID=362788 RepID=A0A834TJ71_9FABA|nr:F-box protein PP2-A13-like [Senna tora]